MITKMRIFVLSVCFYIGGCSAQPQYIEAKISQISQISDKANDATIKIEYQNVSDNNVYFYKFNDCQDEILFYDMLEVRQANNRKEPAYLGPVDYLPSVIQRDNFIILNKGDKIACLIDLSFFYGITPSQNYDVSVKAFNPRIEQQEAFLIQSKKTRLSLQSSK